jgi:Protein of unknown function (DUF3795)
MKAIMSACGVMCSGCAAYHGREKGLEHQERAAAAWQRIYRLKATPGQMVCGGCLAPNEDVFHSSRACKARNCCRAKGFSSCAECDVRPCPLLEKAQSVWDGVPKIAAKLSPADLKAYAKPYLEARRRLAAARAARA